MNLLKKEILNKKYLLLKYSNIIPKAQLPKFEKDIETIFENYEKTEDEFELKNINKLAIAKLKSIKRIYGEFESKQRVEIYDYESQKIIDELSNDYKNDEYETNFKELINSDGFNPILVKKYRDEYNKLSESINRQIIGDKEDKTTSNDELRFNKIIQSDEIKMQIKEFEKGRMTEYFKDVTNTLDIKDKDKINFKNNNLDEAIDQLLNQELNNSVNKQKMEELEFLKYQENFSSIIF
jgi:hypothetical protein